MSEPKRCQRCGKPLPQADLLGGRCPRCMLELGMESEPGNAEGPEPGIAPEHPAVIGRYRILRLIGEGGMGAVYEAEQEHKASDGEPRLKQIFLASLEQGEGRARGGAVVVESHVGWSASWSCDGKWIAFNRQNNIVILSMSNGMEWEFFSPNPLDDFGEPRPLWYLDGHVQHSAQSWVGTKK